MSVILVTGSSGFIGTNLITKLLASGEKVIGMDNFSSSERWKSNLHNQNPNYEFIEHDITKPLGWVLQNSDLLSKGDKIKEIYNLACPASPPRYQALPLETIEVNTKGMMNVLDIAREHGAKLLHTSTSEVYGDPEVHPQPENYRGNVNTLGPRSCYDEGKRIAETICYEYHKLYDVEVKIVRIFNTYGPFMDPEDGRVVTNFILQALDGKPLTIFGAGNQTRSFQYIDDLLDGFQRMMQTEAGFIGPVNIGNPDEFTVEEFAKQVLELTHSKSELTFKQLPQDDPKQRKPDISLAQQKLGWRPRVNLTEGLQKTIAYFKERLYDKSNKARAEENLDALALNPSL